MTTTKFRYIIKTQPQVVEVMEIEKKFWECVARHFVAAYESNMTSTPVTSNKICSECSFVHECGKSNLWYWRIANVILKEKTGISCQIARKD